MTLSIGQTLDGKPFTLPEDLGDKKIALLAQSNKGKTYGLGVILEELVAAKRPFIAEDPANNLYGLRVRPDGSPSGLPVVVIGGDHADIPLEKDAGERMAEALLSTPICAVIDVAFESAGTVRRFMTDFATRLMRTKPEIPRVIVLEECPVLIPQNAFGVQAQMCKAAVSKLATIGGNFGYGVIPACQRPATMDKDVLSQCEALIVMGITHKKDRVTVKEWMEAKDIGERAAAAFAELGSLPPGHAWFWWPSEDRFERFIFRKRETLHPREMRKLKLRSDDLQLGDANQFVEKLRRELTRTSSLSGNAHTHLVPVLEKARRRHRNDGPTIPADAIPARPASDELVRENGLLNERIEELNKRLATERDGRHDAERRLSAVRAALEPQYSALKVLFDATPSGEASGVDPTPYKKWMDKAPKTGIRVMLENLVKKTEFTREQLCTLAGVARTTGYDYVSWLRKNQLVEVEKNGTVRLLRMR